MHEAVVRRADAEGLVEVAYCELDSPFGPMLAAATEAGLVLLSFPGPDRGAILERIAGSVSPRMLHMPYRFDSIRRQLEEYFDGARKRFDVELDWQLTSGFTRAVLERTSEIPFGSTRTYSEMAELAGSPRAHRAAGSALGANPIPIIVPCHRVLRVG
ncbi:MAG: methylated-DNA--[protein]-cysteine S-methyltransferase, partial [Solirubrobacterales bacterium]